MAGTGYYDALVKSHPYEEVAYNFITLIISTRIPVAG
jgi:hypothetical protein